MIALDSVPTTAPTDDEKAHAAVAEMEDIVRVAEDEGLHELALRLGWKLPPILSVGGPSSAAMAVERLHGQWVRDLAVARDDHQADAVLLEKGVALLKRAQAALAYQNGGAS